MRGHGEKYRYPRYDIPSDSRLDADVALKKTSSSGMYMKERQHHKGLLKKIAGTISGFAPEIRRQRMRTEHGQKAVSFRGHPKLSFKYGRNE